MNILLLNNTSKATVDHSATISAVGDVSITALGEIDTMNFSGPVSMLTEALSFICFQATSIVVLSQVHG